MYIQALICPNCKEETEINVLPLADDQSDTCQRCGGVIYYQVAGEEGEEDLTAIWGDEPNVLRNEGQSSNQAPGESVHRNKKLLCYVDRSGPDAGYSGVILGILLFPAGERYTLSRQLQRIQSFVGTSTSWRRTAIDRKRHYLVAILSSLASNMSMYVARFASPDSIVERASNAIDAAVWDKSRSMTRVTVLVNGFTKPDIVKLASLLHGVNRSTAIRKVRQCKKADELAHLTDALVGFIRNEEIDRQSYAQELGRRLLWAPTPTVKNPTGPASPVPSVRSRSPFFKYLPPSQQPLV